MPDRFGRSDACVGGQSFRVARVLRLTVGKITSTNTNNRAVHTALKFEFLS
jgi:hypothetical protein